MRNIDLINRLKQLEENAEVWINYPNDDQNWEPFLTVRESNEEDTDIELKGGE